MSDTIDLQERLIELELDLMRNDWIELGTSGAQQEFSRDGIRRIVELARLYYIKNPLIKRGVKISTYYVFGRGVNIAAKDNTIDECIQTFLDDPSNQREFSGAQARKELDRALTIDGNLFFVFFVHKETGQVRIGTLPVDEIEEIIKARNNRKRNMWYKRTWETREIDEQTGNVEVKRTSRYYRDYLNNEVDTAKLGDIEVDQNAVIYHVKVGGFADWAFGISETYAAQAWAKAYVQFLTNFASVVATLAMFAARKRSSGGKAGVAATRSKLASTLTGSTGESNPPRAAGSVSIEGGPEDAWDPIKTANATTPADEGRPMRVMVAAGFGLPDTMLSGDADMGNLATAQTLDRPTEFQFVDRQELWVGIYKTILDFVVFNAVIAPQGTLTSVARPIQNVYKETVIRFNEDINSTIVVDFPSILERDTGAYLNSLLGSVNFFRENTQDPSKIVAQFARSILIALGYQDVDELLEQVIIQPQKPVDKNPIP